MSAIDRVYVDTSVLVPLFVNETHSALAADWYANEERELVAATWCMPEFASALGIKQRTGALAPATAAAAWARFQRLVDAHLNLLPVAPAHFRRAADLVLDASTALRAGDALHLACAELGAARCMATLDDVLARNAAALGIEPVPIRNRI